MQGSTLVAFVLLGFFLGASACMRGKSGSGEAPVDVPVAPVSAVAPQATQATLRGGPRAGNAPRTCELQLNALAIWKSAPGCYLDVSITDGPGTLTYPCSGDGPASADFGGKHRYIGKLVDGVLDLTLTTELDWEDGCHWATTATVKGTLHRDGKLTHERLGWSYADRVVHGDNCSAECTARSGFEVSESMH